LSDADLDKVTGGSMMSIAEQANPSEKRYAEGHHRKFPGLSG
jgi:hypothetical protein